MKNDGNLITLPEEMVMAKIYWIRGQKVIHEFDLAQLYGIEVKRLKEAVRRNIKRFPSDFLFELTEEEQISLRSQFASLKRGEHSKYRSFVFTEQGVAMLSGIINSDRAIHVNIAIMRAFVQLRKFVESNKDLSRKIEELEKAVSGHDEKIRLIFAAIKQLMENRMEETPPERTPIGYRK
jgi:hypothetical protein